MYNNNNIIDSRLFRANINTLNGRIGSIHISTNTLLVENQMSTRLPFYSVKKLGG